MKHSISRRQWLASAWTLTCAAWLPRPVQACEFFSTSLRVYHPWTRETDVIDDFAVVCMKFDEVGQSDRLVGVSTPVAAGAEMSGPQGTGPVNLSIPVGQVVELREDGPHIRLIGLRQPLLQGRSYPMTLLFERGGQVDAQLSVDYTRT